MDISGVDVDTLNNDEILELCNDIADTNTDEIFVLTDVDINNLPDDKVQQIYDDFMACKKMPKYVTLTDEQMLDSNYGIVDKDNDEILLLNGYNINLDNLQEDELLSLYDDTLENSKSDFIAAYKQTFNTYYLAGQLGLYYKAPGGPKYCYSSYTDLYCKVEMYMRVYDSDGGENGYEPTVSCYYTSTGAKKTFYSYQSYSSTSVWGSCVAK